MPQIFGFVTEDFDFVMVLPAFARQIRKFSPHLPNFFLATAYVPKANLNTRRTVWNKIACASAHWRI